MFFARETATGEKSIASTGQFFCKKPCLVGAATAGNQYVFGFGKAIDKVGKAMW